MNWAAVGRFQAKCDDLLEIGDNHLLVVSAPDPDDRPRGLDPLRDMTAAGLIPFNLVAIRAPLSTAVAAAAVTGRLLFALVALASPLMAARNAYESRHRAKTSNRRDVREFAERLQALREQLTARAQAEPA